MSDRRMGGSPDAETMSRQWGRAACGKERDNTCERWGRRRFSVGRRASGKDRWGIGERNTWNGTQRVAKMEKGKYMGWRKGEIGTRKGCKG